MARHTLDVLGHTDGPIIIPSGSCTDMIRHHYPELLADDPVYGPLAVETAARVFEFSEYLVDVLAVTRLPGPRDDPEAAPIPVAYHPSCHLLRGLKVTEAPRVLLEGAKGVAVVELQNAEECCGFGGLFAVKMSDISGAMLQRKLDAIERSGVATVVACDVSCLLHIAGGLHRRGAAVEAKHLAEVLLP